jgi:hypothetical protein
MTDDANLSTQKGARDLSFATARLAANGERFPAPFCCAISTARPLEESNEAN